MDNKLLRFFNEINFDEEYFEHFKDAKIEQVEVNTKKKTWIIYIYFEKLIDINIFNKLCECSKNIKKIDKVYFKFKFNEGKTLLSDYFWYYFEKLLIKCPMLEGIKSNNIIIEDDIIKIEILNKVQENKIAEIIPNIKTFLEDLGFKIEFQIFINEEARNEVKKMLEKKSEVKTMVKRETSIIKGYPIKGEFSKIKSIIT